MILGNLSQAHGARYAELRGTGRTPRRTQAAAPRACGAEQKLVQDPVETARLRGASLQHGSGEELAPVRSEDGHGHRQDAQGAVCVRLLHLSSHQGRQGIG